MSEHYQNMVVDGEEIRAAVGVPAEGQTQVAILAEKQDGTPVLTGTASVGSEHDASELENRLARMRPFEKLIIRAEGDRITLKINGYTTATYREKDRQYVKPGIIGLQIHSGGQVEVQFRNLRIKELTAKD